MAKLVTIFGTLLVVAGAATSTPRASEASERALRQAMGYSQRGMHSLEKGNAARAAEDFRRALEQIPNLPDAHAGLGHVAMQQHRFEDALVEYRRAQEAYSSFAAQRVDLAQARFSRNKDEIQRLTDEKSALDREQMRVQVQGGSLTTGSAASEGRLQRDRTMYEQSIARLESQTQQVPALEADASDPPAAYYFYEANALFNLKKNDDAIAAWERAVAKDPRYGVAYNNLAVAYWMTGRLDAAQTSLSKAESLGFKVNPSFRADRQKSVAQKRGAAAN
jgi:tetratricopeptide (TPR) repeat protein